MSRKEFSEHTGIPVRTLEDWEAARRTHSEYIPRHGNKAKNGWYRYDTRFGIPVYSGLGEIERYNIFRARMLVRCDENSKKVCEHSRYRNSHTFTGGKIPTLRWIFSEDALLGILFDFCYIEFIEDASNE